MYVCPAISSKSANTAITITTTRHTFIVEETALRQRRQRRQRPTTATATIFRL